MSAIITTINPTTGTTLATYNSWDEAQIESAVARGHQTALAWGEQPLSQRVAAVQRVADQLRQHKAELANIMTLEMGKPLRESEGEVEKSAVTAEYYVKNAERLLGDEAVQIDGVDAWVSYEPIGLVLAVMPWNFPLWQVMRFALPSLVAGNGVLLKHSPNVTGSALAIEKLLIDAGLPAGLLTTLVIAEPDVPNAIESLIADDRIAAVTLTGSNSAGAAVGSAAGRVSKKSVLELGGSDAFIVLEDADVAAAAAAAVKARYNNAGQSCVCAKRFIVAQSVAEQFTQLFVEGAAKLRMGDPLDASTDIGPMARPDLVALLQRQIDASVAAGAKLLLGGQTPSGSGSFYPPTVLANTQPGMAVFNEETFGPAAAIAIAQDDTDAARLANATPFGLSVSIWTASKIRGVALAKKITSGAAFINAMTASDARLPFGGTKKSGYGRELAAAGVREFTNIRTYWASR
jgi:succinate-semialdehyde dehydrogenase/glutarate-semialdehyde dehydrogenase